MSIVCLSPSIATAVTAGVWFGVSAPRLGANWVQDWHCGVWVATMPPVLVRGLKYLVVKGLQAHDGAAPMRAWNQGFRFES